MRGFTADQKFWCYLSISSGVRYTNSDIRESQPYRVDTFIDMVKFIAELANENPDYSLFFRGQGKDYAIESGASTFYPSIFRKDGSLSFDELRERYTILDNCTSAFIEFMGADTPRNDYRIRKYQKFPELVWAVLQHYIVCETPLLDVTQSYRVAASFAYHTKHPQALIFVYAVPYPSGTISFSAEEEMLMIKLQSTCPPDALRPHFQEGYLLGNFPSRAERKSAHLDFGKRLIAKIEIPKDSKTIREFRINPKTDLYPENDDIEIKCEEIRKTHNPNSSRR